MSHRLRSLSAFFWAAGLCSMAFESAYAQTSENPRPERVIITRPSAAKPSGLTLDIDVGAGQFPDLQAPAAITGDRRVDGTTLVQDSSQHKGAMLGAWLGLNSVHSLGSSYVRGGGFRIGSEATNNNKTVATYGRLALIGGSQWDAKTLWHGFNIITEAEVRRSMFRNIDTGHYADSVLVRGGFKQSFGTVAVSTTGAYAPVTNFGYNQGISSSSSGTLADTSAKVSEWATSLSYTPIPDASFALGLAQENVATTINDLRGYKGLGLAVDDSPDADIAKSYSLTTTTLTLSIIRRF